jgi:hypothetical protein
VFFRDNGWRACAVAVVLAAASPAHAQNSNGRLVVGVTVIAPCQVSFVADLAQAAPARREPDVSCPRSDAFETKFSSTTVATPIDIPTSEDPAGPVAAQVSEATKQPAVGARGGASMDVRIVEVAF